MVAFLGIVPVIFTGCDKEELVEPVTITVKAGPNGVIEPSGIIQLMRGETRTIKVVANPGYRIKFLKVDLTEQEIGNYPQEFNYSFTAGYVSIPIDVEFVHEDVIMITKAPWFEKSREVYLEDTWVDAFILEEELTWIYVFSMDNTIETFKPGVSKAIGGIYWDYIAKNTFITWRGPYKNQYTILELTETSFVIKSLWYTNPKDGSRVYLKRTFWRPMPK